MKTVAPTSNRLDKAIEAMKREVLFESNDLNLIMNNLME